MNWFYGIRGIELIWHGSYADPELIWHGKSFNYYDVETPMWEEYTEDCRERGTAPTNEEFRIWMKKNAHLARYFLQELKDHKCFYKT